MLDPNFDKIGPKDPPLPVEIKAVQDEVQLFVGNHQKHLAYELVVTNWTKTPIRIVAVKSNNKIITGKDLKDSFSSISTVNTFAPEDPILQPNSSGIIFVFLDFPYHTQVSNLIKNILYVQIENDSNSLQAIISNPIVVNKYNPIRVSPPLKGEYWYVVDGPANFTAHRRATFVLNGNIKIPERLAVDFLKYGAKGLLDGDPYKNESYYSYGQPVYSVGSGEVVGIMDGIPDNIPNSFPKDVTSKTIGGNYILIKLDSNHYAFFGHLIPGSLKVKVGDIVYTGEKIASLGNSGNSQTPHLHFQITNKVLPIYGNLEPAPVNSQGIPWSFDNFILEKYKPIGNDPIIPGIPLNFEILSSTEVEDEILMLNNLVSFEC
jgi:hypothetical protein